MARVPRASRWLIHAGLTFGVIGLGCAPAPAAAPPPRVQAPRLSPAEIAKRSNPSVVLIEHEGGRGSGFVIASDGRIATNLHVVEGAQEITVTFPDRRKFTVTDVWTAGPKTDLAVLRIEAKGLTPLRLGDSRAVHAGDHIVAIGNPRGFEHTVSDGLMSGLREDDPKNPILQISAPISPGSSGGPVFNDAGEVIGVTTSTVRDAQNLNFAIPASELEALLAKNAEPVPIAEFRALAGHQATTTNVCDVRQPNLPACEERCQKGDAGSCTELGYLLRRSRGGARDDARAAELYKRGCDGGDAVGCSNLAALYRNGEGVGRDAKRAAELYQTSCDHGAPVGCWGLGQLHIAGEGVPPNAARATQLLERACDGKLADACLEAAQLHEKGSGRSVPRRIDRAAGFYQRACDHGEAKACTKLGALLTEARGLPHDEPRAAILFRRGCEGRDADGCARYAGALLDGRGIAADRTLGLEFLRRACKEGSGASCDRIKTLR